MCMWQGSRRGQPAICATNYIADKLAFGYYLASNIIPPKHRARMRGISCYRLKVGNNVFFDGLNARYRKTTRKVELI